MTQRWIVAAALVLVASSCEDKDEGPPPAERAGRERARAEEMKDFAKQQLEAADKKIDETASKVGLDWHGPEKGFADHFGSFAHGDERSAEHGDYTLERAKDGAITVWRRTKQVAGDAFAELKDAALVTQVKAKLAADERTRAIGIDVDAEDHVVHLRGEVSGPREAGEAVRIALGTPGAERVVSHLTWKGGPSRARK